MKDYEEKIKRLLDRWSQKQLKYNRKNNVTENIIKRSEPKHDEETIEEPAKRIPILDRCDVLVVGGGPAGISAALAAKRTDPTKRVILMERYGCLGGNILIMETLQWFKYEGCVDTSGIGVEMERIAIQMGGTTKWPYNNSRCLDGEFFKIVADHLIEQAGVVPILHCLAVETIIENNRIKGVITESKSGRQAILTDFVIDCTGDADIAYLAGVETVKTNREEMMGTTTVFSVAGVDIDKFKEYTEQNPKQYRHWSDSENAEWSQETTGKEDHLPTPFLDEEFKRAKQQGIIESCDNLGGSWSALSYAGEATNLNLVHMKEIDGTNVKDLTRAEMKGRRETLNAIMALKGTVSGFENAKLRNFGMTLGVRDTRKLIGRHKLTGKEATSQFKCDDSIGIFPEFLDGYSVLILPTNGRYFQVPLGCCIPKDSKEVSNLLVAGRCVSTDKLGHTAMRNMMACCVTGQGCGVASVIYNKLGKFDIEKIQEELLRQGVRIE